MGPLLSLSGGIRAIYLLFVLPGQSSPSRPFLRSSPRPLLANSQLLPSPAFPLRATLTAIIRTFKPRSLNSPSASTDPSDSKFDLLIVKASLMIDIVSFFGILASQSPTQYVVASTLATLGGGAGPAVSCLSAWRSCRADSLVPSLADSYPPSHPLPTLNKKISSISLELAGSTNAGKLFSGPLYPLPHLLYLPFISPADSIPSSSLGMAVLQSIASVVGRLSPPSPLPPPSHSPLAHSSLVSDSLPALFFPSPAGCQSLPTASSSPPPPPSSPRPSFVCRSASSPRRSLRSGGSDLTRRRRRGGEGRVRVGVGEKRTSCCGRNERVCL